jgi:hypothetical protein
MPLLLSLAMCPHSMRPSEMLQVSLFDDSTVDCAGVTYSIPEDVRSEIVFNECTRLFPLPGFLCVRYYVKMDGGFYVTSSAHLPEMMKK